MAIAERSPAKTPPASTPSPMPVAPLEVIELEGDGRQRGAALARLLDRAMVRETLPFYARYLSSSIRSRRPATPQPVLRMIDGATGVLLDYMALRQDREVRAAIDALAEGEPRAVRRAAHRAHSVLDALQLLLGRVPGLAHLVQAPAACSSLIALGAATTDGSVLHGRNFDLHTPDATTTAPLLQVHRPRRGNAHVSIFHRAAFAPGPTSVNDRGLSISVHTHFTQDASLRGTPIVSIARSIAEESKSLGDAVDRLRRAHPLCGWSFYLADAGAKAAACVERGYAHAVVREPEDGLIWGANQFIDPTMHAREVTPSAAFVGHNRGRLLRLAELARGHHGRIDPASLARILGDGVDPEAGAVRALGGALSVSINVLSVIFAVDADRIYVGRGGVPASAGRYDGLVLSRLFERGEVEIEESLLPALDEPARTARHALAEAAAAWQRGGDRAVARRALDRAIAATPDDPTLRIVRAVLRLAYDPEGAAQDLAHAARQPMTPLSAAHRELVAGYAADLRGRPDEAASAYRAAMASEIPEVVAAARKALRKPVRRRDAENLGPDLIVGGPAL